MERLDSMGRRNGMFNKEISKKVHRTLKLKYLKEKHPNKGKKRPDLSKRNKENVKRGEEHPRWNRIYKKNCKYCNNPIEFSFCFRNQKFCNEKCYWKYLREFGHSDEVMKAIRENRKHQKFPKKDTTIEVKIQNFLKELKIEFFTHQYMKIKHGYQCDILIPSMNLVIEADGDYWHGNKEIFRDERLTERIIKQRELDNIRTSELISKGIKVLRLWENEIKIININQFKNKLVQF